MPQEIFRQANFTGGELDPTCLARRDLKAYASALAISVNLWPQPQGPIRRRPGLAHLSMVRNRLEDVASEGVTVAVPNGGTAAALFDGTGFATDTGLSTTDGYVIAEFDFGAPVALGGVDLTDYAFVPSGVTPQPPGPNLPWWKQEQLEVEP